MKLIHFCCAIRQVMGIASVARKYLWEFPENQVKIPIKFPTQMKFPHYGEKVGFIAFLLTNLLVLAINMSKYMKLGQVLKKSVSYLSQLSLPQFQTNTLFCFTKQSNVKDYVPKLGSYPQICIFRADLYHLLRNLLWILLESKFPKILMGNSP